ncbi:MAG: PEP-CTERM sorting domain-containing protein [Verrucomicrobia bacterium]|nr:PEP-CTERM sorting domain-containing protein [Verrucomicrobiota bacterium]
MKKTIIASVIGIAASVATVSSSYGQGHTLFDNYNAAPYMNVRYNGTPTGNSGIHVDLAYFIGTTSDPTALTPLGLSVPLNGSLTALGQPGYWNGVAVDIPGYTSGAVTFQVLAWDTATGATYGAATARGASFLWQEASLATGLSPAATWAGLPGPNGGELVNVVVPEPSTFALIGLGTGVLLFFRRRK